ncbi:peptidoglycan editing factor PgeF [Arthrobacter sp. zg-Y411]|nr:peptidoglycan editing factor PgeF [Arthrobacter zhangbolii]MCC3293805.1 peptidoglycan editing factor PgeF [Arthrobacter zhangbolii]
MFWWHRQVEENLWVGFTDASAGNLALHVGDDPEAVLRRRADLEAAMGVAPASLRFMNQVHSATVLHAQEAGEAAPTADGLISTDGLAPLAVMVADCVPVLLAGRTTAGTAVTAAVHAGRRGLLDGILPVSVARMRAAGAASIRAWIGPCICGSCYEVPAAMRADAAAVLPAAAASTREGTPALDLPAGAQVQLEDLGVDVERIEGCTRENAELYSHRRDPGTGRIAGVIWRRP